jgi:hypothetical protein
MAISGPLTPPFTLKEKTDRSLQPEAELLLISQRSRCRHAGAQSALCSQAALSSRQRKQPDSVFAKPLTGWQTVSTLNCFNRFRKVSAPWMQCVITVYWYMDQARAMNTP